MPALGLHKDLDQLKDVTTTESTLVAVWESAFFLPLNAQLLNLLS